LQRRLCSGGRQAHAPRRRGARGEGRRAGERPEQRARARRLAGSAAGLRAARARARLHHFGRSADERGAVDDVFEPAELGEDEPGGGHGVGGLLALVLGQQLHQARGDVGLQAVDVQKQPHDGVVRRDGGGAGRRAEEGDESRRVEALVGQRREQLLLEPVRLRLARDLLPEAERVRYRPAAALAGLAAGACRGQQLVETRLGGAALRRPI